MSAIGWDGLTALTVGSQAHLFLDPGDLFLECEVSAPGRTGQARELLFFFYLGRKCRIYH
jgi:hypothetical protein